MKKIMFNRPVKREPWGGGGHMIVALYDYLIKKGYNIVFELEDNIDIILIFDPRPHLPGTGFQSILEYKSSNPGCKVVQRINDTDIARPNDTPWRDEMFKHVNSHVDYTIFISSWVKEYFEKQGIKSNSQNSKVIINGCNSNWFYPAEKKKLNMKNIKFITHHWSDNPMKGLDVYKFMDIISSQNDNIEFTYLGRYSKGYTPTNTNIVPPAYGKDIGKILRDHDIYITGARYEACGSHHIEAALCGLPVIFHSQGGAVPEVCKNHGKGFSDDTELIQAINDTIRDFNILRDKIDYNFLSMDRCCRDYEKCLLDLFNDKKVQ